MKEAQKQTKGTKTESAQEETVSIHIRTTQRRKEAYERRAKKFGQSVNWWIKAVCDQAANFNEEN